MKRYRVLIRGENFQLAKAEGQVRNLGFYTTRIVEAADPREAEVIALELIWQNKRLDSQIANDPSNPPQVFAEETEEIESSGSGPDIDQGFVFFES
jgi:hypothetical protein